MAKGKISSPPAGAVTLVNLTITRSESEKKIAERVERGKEFLNKNFSSEDELEQIHQEYAKWNTFNTEMLCRIFDKDEIARQYSYSPMGGR